MNRQDRQSIWFVSRMFRERRRIAGCRAKRCRMESIALVEAKQCIGFGKAAHWFGQDNALVFARHRVDSKESVI